LRSWHSAIATINGDKSCDIELGRRTGAIPFLVRTGHGALWEREGIQADYIVDDVLAAAHFILENSSLQSSQT
jgi:hypothetical protein